MLDASHLKTKPTLLSISATSYQYQLPAINISYQYQLSIAKYCNIITEYLSFNYWSKIKKC